MGTGTVLGTLVLAWAEDHVLSAEERTMMHTLAGYTAQALQRSLLFAERVSAAQALQLSLLPTLPRVDHLELVARYRPARAGERVGGDWFDGFHLPDGALALVIGDVVGHDMRAAASMGQLRNMLRAFAYDRGEPPSEILRRLDHAITGLHLSTVATVIMARVEQTAADRARGVRRLRWSNAGHPPPMLLRPDGTVEPLTAARPSPLLGLRQPVSRFDTEAVLEPGSTVLFYTDGLVERRDSDLETGMRRLAAAVAELAGLPVDGLLDGLLDRLTGRGTEDDVALLAVRAHPQDGATAPAATSVAAGRPVSG
jgi:serine phosphatase RsbU (regulator of sigma subunit)